MNRKKTTEHSSIKKDGAAGNGAEVNSAPSFLDVAIITSPWGVKGEMKANIVTDFPERLPSLKTVYVDGKPFEVEGVRFHKKQALLRLKGIDSVEAAEKLRNKTVEVPLAEAPELPEEHYYYYQIFGLDVVATDGRFLGKVADILPTASNDVYVVKDSKGREILIPATEDVVQSIDLKKGQIVIEPIEGLL